MSRDSDEYDLPPDDSPPDDSPPDDERSLYTTSDLTSVNADTINSIIEDPRFTTRLTALISHLGPDTSTTWQMITYPPASQAQRTPYRPSDSPSPPSACFSMMVHSKCARESRLQVFSRRSGHSSCTTGLPTAMEDRQLCHPVQHQRSECALPSGVSVRRSAWLYRYR